MNMDDPRWPTAIHEAGHAVVSRAIGRPVRAVSIRPDEKTLGRVTHYPMPSFKPDAMINTRTRLRLEQMIMVYLGGVEAEKRVVHQADVESFAATDIDRAQDLAFYMSNNEPDEAGAYLGWLQYRTRNLLNNPVWWAAVVGLADCLLIEEGMGGAQAYAAIQVAIDKYIARYTEGAPS